MSDERAVRGPYSHDLIDGTGAEARWFGRPFPKALHDNLERMGHAADRLAPVGDTLEADILGGRAGGGAPCS